MSKLLIILLSSILIVSNVYANTGEIIELSSSDRSNIFKAIINSNDTVKVGRGILFDASDSIVYDNNVQYNWDFGDKYSSNSKQFVHIYNTPGIYEVTLKIKSNNIESIAKKNIYVYSKEIPIFTDTENIPKEMLDDAKKQNILLSINNIFHIYDIQNIIKKDIDIIIFYIDNIKNISQFYKLKQIGLNISDKYVFIIFKENTFVNRGLVNNFFRIISPKKLVHLNYDTIFDIFQEKKFDDILYYLRQRNKQYTLYDEISATFSYINLFSYILNNMIASGVAVDIINILLILPLIVTIVAISRHIIGLATAGIYLPSIIAISFIPLGWIYGSFLTLMIYLLVYLYKNITKKWRIYVAPYIAIMITIITLIIMFFFGFGIYFGIINPAYLQETSVYPILILILSSERFMSIQLDRGFKSSLFLILDTILVASLCYIFIEKWSFLKTLILINPELIIFIFLINFLISKYKGLRLLEFIKFRNIQK